MNIRCVLGISLLVFAHPVWATDQVLMSGSQYNMPNTVSHYAGISGNENSSRTTGWNDEFGGVASEGGLVSAGGTFKTLRVVLSAAPGAGKSYQFTLRLDQADTALTCTVSGTDTSCTDTSNTVSASAGQLVALEKTASGTPTAVQGRFSLIFTPTTANDTLLIGAATSDGGHSAQTRFMPVSGVSGQSGSEIFMAVMPAAGTIKNLYIKAQTAPGAGTSRVLTIRKNAVDTAVTCTLSDTATTCNDTSNSFTVVAGDTVSLANTIGSGSPSGAAYATGLTWNTTTAGDFGIFETGDINNTATLYGELAGGDTNWNTTEANNPVLAQVCTASAFYARLNLSPGSGTSYTFTVRQNQAATALSCAISGTGTTCNDTGSVSLANDDLMNHESVPSNTPTNRFSQLGVLCNISAAAARRTWLISDQEESHEDAVRLAAAL